MMQEEVQRPVLLFVDDEAAILSALRRLFRPEGYRILLAESAAAGLAILETEPVDLVVSDMRMPGMDGAQFLEQVRLRWPQVVRMLLTGYADIGSTIAAINRGEIHRYIAKPWEDHEMLLSVRDGLDRRRLQRENEALQALTQAQNEELRRVNDSLASRVKARTQELEQVNAMLEKAYAQLQDNFLLSIRVFSGLMELRLGGNAGYSRRVAELARRIAREMRLGPQMEQDVFVAGLLHEVGKIGLPDALLGKPLSALSAEELGCYRRHTLAGEAALMPLEQLRRAAGYLRSHHERVDGKGFPDGLSGEAVPLGAQILAVASDYHAAQSGRMAQKRYSEDEARALIHGGRGARYEVQVVEGFDAAVRALAAEPPADRLIAAQDVQPGMVLARDLTTPRGALLLAQGHVFDARVVRQIREYVQREGARLTLYVRNDEAAGRAPAPGTGAGAAALPSQGGQP